MAGLIDTIAGWLGSGNSTRAICSTLIAQAFQTVGDPILPLVEAVPTNDPAFADLARRGGGGRRMRHGAAPKAKPAVRSAELAR